LIVEFIGTTGAGKTTLISEVYQCLSGMVEVKTAYEVVAPTVLHGVRNSSARNLVQELIGLPSFTASARRHREFIVFVLKMLRRQAKFSIFTINNLRSLERKLGVYEIVRRRHREQIVLVDEGTVLTAHNIFVFTSASYSPREIAHFAKLAPLPDAIVYIKAPAEILVRRSLERSDPPREMRGKNPEQVRRHIERAMQMFDRLVQAENIRPRTFVAENCDAGEAERERLVQRITHFIIEAERQRNHV
jgi:thymidylate kinase